MRVSKRYKFFIQIYNACWQLEELTGYTDAKRLPANLTVPELLFKLQTTQTELERCQATMREKTYADAEKLDSEPEIVLHFLRDSIFHFLTDHKTAEQHLNAIIGMLGFPEEQIKKIESSRDKDHRRLWSYPLTFIPSKSYILIVIH